MCEKFESQQWCIHKDIGWHMNRFMCVYVPSISMHVFEKSTTFCLARLEYAISKIGQGDRRFCTSYFYSDIRYWEGKFWRRAAVYLKAELQKEKRKKRQHQLREFRLFGDYVLPGFRKTIQNMRKIWTVIWSTFSNVHRDGNYSLNHLLRVGGNTDGVLQSVRLCNSVHVFCI